MASDAYLIWWAFQLLGFAQREVSRAFDGIAGAEKAALGKSSLPLAP